MTSTTVSHALWIRRERPVFAWYHGPADEARDVGVLLCKPFGYEMMCTHRAYRHLAVLLAESGFPTLRMDYDGTGDSSGSDTDPDRVPSWVQSIDAGVHELQRRGMQRIALVGVRFGALLAAEYAKTHPVDALVLIAPPPSGRAYLRELRAFQSMRADSENGAKGQADGVEEAVGFLLGKDTKGQLASLSLVDSSCPARRALVVARDDIPGPEAKVVEQLTALGTPATLLRTRGYAAMMQEDPVKSVVPDAVWKDVVRWLGQEPSSTIHPSSKVDMRTAHVRAAEFAPAVSEEIVDLDGMFGILCRPVESPRMDAPVVMLHNVGANHHVGCNRIYVDFARRWASLGFSVLRFDMVGVGDTPPSGGRRENDVYSDSCAVDSGRALDNLVKRGVGGRFILGGICSGAYVSYYAALANDRVDGVMLMNPLTFHWHEGDSLDVRARSSLKSTQFYRQAAFEVGTWRRLARGQVHVRAIASKLAAFAWSELNRSTAEWLGARIETDITRGFRRLCDRGARVILICGENDGSRDVVTEHLGPDARKLRGHANFKFEIARNTDHTFSPHPARQALSDRLTAYLVNETEETPSRRIPKSLSFEALSSALRR